MTRYPASPAGVYALWCSVLAPAWELMVCAAPTVPCMSFEQTNHQTEGSRFTFTGLSVSFCHSTKELHCTHAEPHCAHASFVLRLIKHFPFVPYVYATAAPLICPIKRGAGLLILTQQLGVFFFFCTHFCLLSSYHRYSSHVLWKNRRA